jgi:predicted RecB family nuclease
MLGGSMTNPPAPQASLEAEMAGHKGRDWVSKTDLTTFLRCQYAFWLLDTGQVEFDDVADTITARLLEEGRAFQERVVAEATPLPADVDFSMLVASDCHLIGFPWLVKNHDYKILGRPDGVRTAHGALLPIEIKSHKEVTRLDELELAFYWLLLEPLRTTKNVDPVGCVIARIDGHPATIEVPLTPTRFDEVFKTIDAIRKARREGVKPRICRCPVCSASKIRGKIVRTALDGKDLSLIYGIGRHFAEALESMGVQSYEDLLILDPREVAHRLRRRIPNVSPGTVKRWVYHAMSFSRGTPIVFGRERLDFEEMLVLDCEYDDLDFSIWLIGACIVKGARREYRFLWANTRRQEREILQQFASLLAEHPSLPVLTWAGTPADIAHLRNRALNLGVSGVADALPSRHVDAYLFLTRNVRLPTHDFSLKGVATHLGFLRRSRIQNGVQANDVYRQYLRARGARKARLKDEVLCYNKDDLDSIMWIVSMLRSLTTDRTCALGISDES